MKEIKMVDLRTQYLRIKDEIDSAMEDVLNSTAFIKGPQVGEFSKGLQAYLHVSEAIPCGNGTDALQLALMALDLKPGDEIITTPFTFISTIEVICLLGFKPVLADIDPDNFTIDPAQIEKKITNKTKAILPVHLFGQCADMEAIMELAEKHQLVVVEDAAQAIGAECRLNKGHYQKAGTIGNIGCTSFFPSKNLGAFGDGGAVFTNDETLGEKIRTVANHGMKRRYYYDQVGINSRLDTLQAAILNVKLRHLDQFNQARQKAAEYYDKALGDHPGLDIPARSGKSSHVFHQYTLKINNANRNGLKEFLNENNIPAMVYYPVGLHLQNAYHFLGYKKGDFPITEECSEKVLSIPMHTELNNEQLEYITESILEFVNKNS